ncbi:hypothetical protein [Frateuria sp. STR12]|uniref:hypothetical protein n=1 Tax=Frateuria hangzhouensis TaxID=2995589 RepID=UPI002260E22C|nr:hypothetical protein [Frateuria sp. STR12]MCX7515306.1 hypothetical protein [Frateuria sp. STR12]
MIRFSTMFQRAGAALLLGGLLVLGGCHSGSVKEQAAIAKAQNEFDTTVEAYKGGQFLVDGAVLSALDTGSHFAYLKDVGKLPATVLLVRSDDSKIRKAHLQFMARMVLDYGFAVYYEDDGELKKINPVETKARALEDYHAPVKMNDEIKNRDASRGYDSPQQQH